MKCCCPGHTDLLSLLCSFLSPPRSHFFRRLRLQRGEALGVDEPEPTASSSLDGVISIEGSCRNSLEPSDGSLCTCFILRILKRLRRRAGLGKMTLSPLDLDLGWATSRGACTCSAGSCRVSLMLVLFFVLLAFLQVCITSVSKATSSRACIITRNKWKL